MNRRPLRLPIPPATTPVPGALTAKAELGGPGGPAGGRPAGTARRGPECVQPPRARGGCGTHQIAKAGVQFGRAAGHIQRAQAARRQHLGNQRQRVVIHHFGAIRPGAHMAMHAALVAGIAEVDLQRVWPLTPQGRKVGVDQQGKGSAHE